MRKKFMQQKLSILVLVIAFAACNNPVSKTETTITTTNLPTRTETPDQVKNNERYDKTAPGNDNEFSNCYMQVLVRDTFVAHLRLNGNNVTGKLSVDNFEKDGSTGTVTGLRDGDVMKLIYTFQSEGSTSKMEVYYKLTNDGLVRGVGEMNVKGDSSFFVNPNSARYEQKNNLLKKVDCNTVPAKYK